MLRSRSRLLLLYGSLLVPLAAAGLPIDPNDFFADPTVAVAPDGASATLINVSSDTVAAPIYLAIEELTPASVGVVNEDGTSTEGIAYFVFDQALGAGETQSRELLFSRPALPLGAGDMGFVGNRQHKG